MKQALLFISLLVAGYVSAQNVKGHIFDASTKRPITGASVQIKYTGKDATAGTVSNSKGLFQIQKVSKNDSAIVTISEVRYETMQIKLKIAENDLTLDTIFLTKKSKILDEVIVKSTSVGVTQNGDTLEINASQYKVNPDATVGDLVKKMPGFTVEKDGSVVAHGENVQKVTVDGKTFFGDDALAALKNLPADMVEKIQLFDQLSEQARFTGIDDGSSVKALNIVTKAGLKNGQFGRFFGSYGNGNKYSLGGNTSYFEKDRRISIVGSYNNINVQNFQTQDLLGVMSSGSSNSRGGGFGGRGGGGGSSSTGGGGGGYSRYNRDKENFNIGQQSGISATKSIGINYSDKWGKKIDLEGSYFFNSGKNINDESLLSQTLFRTKTQFSNKLSNTETVNNNHRIDLKIEYNIDSAKSLTIRPNISFQNNNSYSTSDVAQYFAIGDTNSTSLNQRKARRNGYKISNNIVYRQKLSGKDKRSYSIGITTNFNNNSGDNYASTQFRFFDSFNSVTDSARNQYSDNPSDGYSLSAKLDYNEPVSKNAMIQFSYSPSYSFSKSDQQTFTYNNQYNKYTTFDTLLSNQFENTIVSHSGEVNYRYSKSRNDNFTVGLSLKKSELQSDRVFPKPVYVNQGFFNILPQASWSKTINTTQNFRIDYRTSTSFPSISQLQDVVNINNPLRISSGNPNLKQALSHALSGRYFFNNKKSSVGFFSTIFIQLVQNAVSTATYVPIRDSVILNGYTLKKGSQLTVPVNLDGSETYGTNFTFSKPIKLIKTNLSLSAGLSFAKIPGIANNILSYTDNINQNYSLKLSSNISSYIDFNIEYKLRINSASNNIRVVNNDYTYHGLDVAFNLLSPNGWFFQNDLSSQWNLGLASGYNQNFNLWNVSIGKKFLKKQAGELKLSVFDILKENQSVYHSVSSNYIEDSKSTVLQQFFMLTFTYNIKNFGTGSSKPEPERGKRNYFERK